MCSGIIYVYKVCMKRFDSQGGVYVSSECNLLMPHMNAHLIQKLSCYHTAAPTVRYASRNP